MSENTTGSPDCPQCEGGGFMLAPERDEWPLQPLPMVPCGNCRTPFDGTASRMDWQRIYDRGFEDGLNSPCRPKAAPVYESPEELAQEVARLRRENTALQQLVTRAEQDIATLTRDRDQALEESAPAPRDRDLTRTLRDAMKRYGVPAVMADAARLAQQRL